MFVLAVDDLHIAYEKKQTFFNIISTIGFDYMETLFSLYRAGNTKRLKYSYSLTVRKHLEPIDSYLLLDTITLGKMPFT